MDRGEEGESAANSGRKGEMGGRRGRELAAVKGKGRAREGKTVWRMRKEVEEKKDSAKAGPPRVTTSARIPRAHGGV